MNGTNFSTTNVVEFGTHRTVLVKNGVRRVVHHNPPLGYHEVLDLILHRITGGTEPTPTAPTATPVQTTTAVVQKPTKKRPSLADLLAADRSTLSELLKVADDVLQQPLLRLAGTSTDRVGGIRLRQSTDVTEGGRPSLGQYRDFRDKPRSLPQLNAVTIQGILIAVGALDTEEKPTEEVLRRIARSASQYRRDHGLGGGDCGPEAVELYIRVFRALSVTNEMAGMAQADDLQRIYLSFLRVSGN